MMQRPTEKKVTVRDIAREANVSVATVSRLINGSGPVGAKTRKRVQAVIDKHGFRPNALARSLYKKKSKMIGFLLPDITNGFFAQLCLEVEKAALELDYSVFLCNSIDDPRLETRYLESLVEKQVDGIILAGGRVNRTDSLPELVSEVERLTSDIPLVILNGHLKGMHCYKIRSDEYHAVETMVEHLTGLGHTSLGLIGGREGITSFDLKLRALRRAIDSYGFLFRDAWLEKSEYSIEGGFQAMERLLSRDQLPSAFIAINDLVAIGAIQACRKHGVAVPDDLSIIGFDDIDLARFINPAITTLAHPYREMGRLAIQTIHDLMEGQEPEDDILLETKLIVRESCRRV